MKLWKEMYAIFENGVACLSNTLLTIHLVSYGALLLYTGNERDGVGCCEAIGFCWEYCYWFLYLLSSYLHFRILFHFIFEL